MLRFGLVMGLLWAKTCENGSDLGRGRPWNRPCTKFLNFKYEPLKICILSVALPKIWWLLGCFHIFYAGNCVTIALR